ncbi:hypothetical protein [Kurthia gibsonii]|uniref:hypothetical protein n=1 Tax=Kurthia gibsonii TaxID=33946 RepID=UPI0031B6804F
MSNFKLVKTAAALALGASVVTSAVATTDASAASKYKIKSGKLVYAKSGKVVKGYVTYKSTVYKNGSKLTGLKGKTYYKAGKKATGTYKGAYYVKGAKKVTTGTYNKAYYVKGVKKVSTGLYASKYYKDGKLATGTYKGAYYVKGLKKVTTGTYNGAYYVKGKKVVSTGLYADKLYVDGKLNKGYKLYNENLYKDAVLNTELALFEGKLYDGAKLNEGHKIFKDELYNGSELNTKLALFEGKLYNGAKLNEGIQKFEDKWYNNAELADGTFTVEGVEKAFENGVEVGAKVKSVEAINAKQVKVTFNKSFGDNGLVTSSYIVRDLASGTPNTVTDVEKVDSRTVVLTLTDAYRVSTDVTVAVEGVYLKGSIKDTFPKFAKVVNVNDTVSPEITDVTAETTSTSSAQTVYVTLSEPIKAGATFRVDGTTVSASLVSPTTYAISGQDLAVGKSHEVEILNAEDYADNKVVSLTKTFSVTQDTTVATGAVSTIQDNKVLVKFDKAITASSLSNVKFFTYNGTAYVPAAAATPVQADKYGKEWIFTLTNADNFYSVNDKTEDVLVKVQSGVIDTAGNLVKPFDATASFKQDTTGPSLQNLTFDKNSKGEVTKLYFAYDELLKATSVDGLADTTDVVVTDLSTNKTVALTNLITIAKDASANDLVQLASDGKTVVVTLDTTSATAKILKNGNYAFELQSGFVKDDAATPNNNKKETVKVNFGAVTNEVTATPSTVAGTPNKFKVVFDQDVTADSAKNPANYEFNGKALPNDTVITVVDSKTVEFTIPAGVIAKDDAAKLVISNIKPKDASATFKTYVGTIAVTDNTAPTMTGSILSNGIGQIAFSEDVTTSPAVLDENDFSIVKVNGLVLPTASYTLGTNANADGSTVATLTVHAEIATADGFAYQYIDVDGISGLDLSKDIVLQKVLGTAPAAWTGAEANLNKVTSVQVVTKSTPATKDAKGNTIAKDTTITLK